MKARRTLPTLSVYANREPQDGAGREANRLALEHAFEKARTSMAGAPRKSRVAFERSEERLFAARAQLDGALNVPAAAWFVGEDGGLLVEPLAYPVEPSVVWRDGVRVAPYLMSAAPLPVIAALVDSEQCTIFRLTGDTLIAIESHDDSPVVEPTPHMGAMPRPGFHTGTRGETQADAAERLRREARARHIHLVTQRLSALAGDACHVIVGGNPEVAAIVMEGLPPELRQRANLAAHLPMASPGPKIARMARESQRALIARRQRELVNEIRNRARHAGRAAIGLAEVAHAADLGAVDHLLVSRDLLEEQPEAVDIVVQEVLDAGGYAEVLGAEEGVALDGAAGGIVARLRFAPPANGVTKFPSCQVNANV